MAEFKFSNAQREMEVYGYDAIVKSHCRLCHGSYLVRPQKKDGCLFFGGAKRPGGIIGANFNRMGNPATFRNLQSY